MAKMGRPVTGQTVRRITLTLNKDAIAQAQVLADKKGCSLSRYVSDVLKEHISKLN